MSKQNVERFYRDLSENSELQKKVLKNNSTGNAKEMAFEMIVSVAQEVGYEISKADLEEYAKDVEELDMAIPDWGKCACSFGGYGYNSKDDCSCACVMGGGGKADRNGKFLCCVVAGVVGG
ncbi:Nif11-like leader peptide family natural product precursor [Dysgonomonas sp.]